MTSTMDILGQGTKKYNNDSHKNKTFKRCLTFNLRSRMFYFTEENMNKYAVVRPCY